jgi:hypothetical protein
MFGLDFHGLLIFSDGIPVGVENGLNESRQEFLYLFA